MKHYLAIDLGAESGRAMLGVLDSGRLHLEELHRFPNTPVRVTTGLYWDTFRLFHEIEHGLFVAGKERKLALDGIGVDTWGVDFGLLGADGSLVDNPRHYRDARNDGMMEKTFAVVPKEQIFAQTGLQFMQFNSLFQLYAAKLADTPGLSAASTLLFMPDLLNYWLTGVRRAELTIASTSQFYNPSKRRWAAELLDSLGIPSHILPEIVMPGTMLGPLLGDVSEHAGLGSVPVFASAGHDTAAAVAAVPASGSDWCYISSGTWSLMGVELDEPLINGEVLAANYTNEVGFGGKIRFLKNIAGLWLLQECRRAWIAEGREYSYAELTELAAAARPRVARLDPDCFLQPGNMPHRIDEYCKSTGQQAPQSAGEYCRVILESLADKYLQVLENLEALTGRRINVIHIVGGGSQNRLLNRLVAETTGRRVIAGPTEATAIGNVMVQAVGAGDVSGLAQAREIIRQSFEIEEAS
jgi:rhamnulokinase